MDAWGWAFHIGIRVVDVLLLGAWLMWFFKQKFDDDGEPEDEDDFGDGGNEVPPPEPGRPTGGDRLDPPRHRLRDHAGGRGTGSRRRPQPLRRRDTVTATPPRPPRRIPGGPGASPRRPRRS